MFSFFKSKKNKPTTIKSTYYIRESIIHNISDLLKAINSDNLEDALVKNIDTEIKFKNLSLVNLTEKQIIAEMDQPIYTYDNSEIIPGHKVLFYKEDVEFYRFLVQFHFINNEFFLVSNKVSASGLLPEKEKSKIINQLIKKYLAKSEVDYNKNVLNFTDENGSVLTTIDDVYFYVNYLTGSPIKNQLIKKYSDSKYMESNESNFEDTIDKYF